jgi:ABC-type nitrate/sulfonate/bicarbonate transport system ATPase subunit
MSRNQNAVFEGDAVAGPVLRFDGVGMRYGRAPEVLKDVSFDLAAGSFHFLTGASGAGKSSLLKLIYLAERPSRGTIELFGRDVDAVHAADRPFLRRRIGVVFQEFRLLEHLSAFDNVALPQLIAGTARAEAEARASDLLGQMGLSARLTHQPAELSGGEQQRVAIARVLANDAEMVLMDEPFGALDAMTRERLQDELLDIWQRTKLTVLFVTHSIEEAIFLADRVVVMEPGPGRIASEHRIELPRPRDVSSPEFNAVRRELSARLHSHHGKKAA